jgi:alpha-L-rhamnosidase
MIRDLYRYYGNQTVMARHYGACARYVDLVRAKHPDLIIPQCIGDHEALDKAAETLTGTAHFYQWASLVGEFATVLGKPEEARKYNQLAAAIRTAFQARFVKDGKVGQGRQGDQVFGLYHRLIPESDRPAALDLLKQDLAAKNGALSTGIYGTKYLLEILSTEGLEELAGKMVARREFPGWGYMLDNGATTLWETWKPSDDVYSQNHPMFGSVEEWFMKHVLGISPAADALGCDKLVIRPRPTSDLTWARGHHATPKGPVRVDWRLANGRMRLSLELPQGVSARVWLADDQKWTDAKAGKSEW